MAVVDLTDKTIVEYASKVLQDELYFFFGSHVKEMLKPLLGDGVGDNSEKKRYRNNLDSAFIMYAEEKLKLSPQFLSLVVRKNSESHRIVITLPGKEKEVRKELQKLEYKVLD